MVRPHYSEWIQGGEMEERERYNDSWARERGESEEVRMVRNRLAWMTCFPPVSKMMSGYGLLSRAKSWSGTPKQPRRPVLMSVNPVTSETFIVVWVTTYGYVGIWELCCHWGHSNIQTQAKHHACVCGLCCCLVAHDAIKGKKKMPRVYVVSLDHAGVWGLCHHQGHDDLIDWHCHLRQWCSLCQCCCWGPCLEPWLCHSQDLCWCLYLLIPSKAMRMPRLRATI